MNEQPIRPPWSPPLIDGPKPMPETAPGTPAPKTIVRYHLPAIGAIQSELYGTAHDIYNFLVGRKEIERFKELDHLGVIRDVFEGAHHSRWEYIVLIMRLIEVAKKVKELHLTTSTTIMSDGAATPIVKAELLKCWALLSNIGHLPGTFACEHALLALVKRNPPLRNEILRRLSDSSVEKHVRGIFRRESLYRFHHVLAFLKLKRWSSKKVPLVLYTEILKAFCLPPSEEIHRVSLIYNDIRRLAFMILDSHYVASIVEIDLRDIMNDPDNIRPFLLREDNPSRKLARDIEEHLFSTIYTAPPVAQRVNVVTRSCSEPMIRSYSQGLNALLGDVSRNQFKQSLAMPSAPRQLVRLPYRAEDPFTDLLLPECRPIRERRTWERKLGADAQVLVWPLRDSHQKNIDIFVPRKSDKPTKVFRLLYKTIEQALADYGRTLASENRKLLTLGPLSVQEYLYGRINENIIRAVMGELFQISGYIEFRKPPISDFPSGLLARSKKEARGFLKESIRLLGKRSAFSSKRDELQALRVAISSEKAERVLFNCASTCIYDQGGRQIAEIDGMYLSLHYNQLRFVIVEAKDSVRPTEVRIKKELTSKIETLRLKNDSAWTYSFLKGRARHPDCGVAVFTL